MCRQAHLFGRQAGGGSDVQVMKRQVLLVRRAREKCLGIWVVIRLATDDGAVQEVSRA